MLTKVLIALAVIVVVLVIVVAMQSSEFRVTRTATISAPAAVVFAQVNDFHKWEAWSPWEKIDPALKRTFEGPSAGASASHPWVGEKKTRGGRRRVTNRTPRAPPRIKT